MRSNAICMLVALAVLPLSTSMAAAPDAVFSVSAATPALPHVAALISRHAPIRIVAFGSSSTEGAGASSPAASYPSRLDADLDSMLPGEDVDVVNDGVGGEDADDFDKRLAHVLSRKPDLVILQTGTNDPLRHVPLERFEAETRADIARLKAAGSDVMLMEPQTCRVPSAVPGWTAYLDAVRRIGSEMGIPVIRRADLMQSWRARHLITDAELFASDGLHMADGGYRLLAQDVAEEILQDSGVRMVQPKR